MLGRGARAGEKQLNAAAFEYNEIGATNLSKKSSFGIAMLAVAGLVNACLLQSALAADPVNLSNGNVMVEGTTPAWLITDRFTGDFGTFVVSNNVKATLDGTANTGRSVDFAHTFSEDGNFNRSITCGSSISRTTYRAPGPWIRTLSGATTPFRPMPASQRRTI
jgi:hypothetical protein